MNENKKYMHSSWSPSKLHSSYIFFRIKMMIFILIIILIPIYISYNSKIFLIPVFNIPFFYLVFLLFFIILLLIFIGRLIQYYHEICVTKNMYFYDSTTEDPIEQLIICLDSLNYKYEMIDSKKELPDRSLPSLFKFIEKVIEISQIKIVIIVFKKGRGKHNSIFQRIFIGPISVNEPDSIIKIMTCISKNIQ